jgi:hypothetical protein
MNKYDLCAMNRFPCLIYISLKTRGYREFVGNSSCRNLPFSDPERVNVVLGIYKHYPGSLSSLKTILHCRHFPLGGHVTTATRETNLECRYLITMLGNVRLSEVYPGYCLNDEIDPG